MKGLIADIKNSFKDIKNSPKKMEWMMAILLLAVCAFCFCFWRDFHLTVTQSIDFLDCVFHGKFFSFYTVVKEKALAGGYGSEWRNTLLAGANYSVINYALIGIFCLPVYIFDKIMSGNMPFLAYEIWIKAGYMFAFIWMTGIVNSISKKLELDDSKRMWMCFAFITSPVFLYSSIMISHMDIFSIFFVMYGFLFMLEEKHWKMLIFFMFAISFKPFIILTVLPILFLREKRILYLGRDCLVSIGGIILQALVFKFDPGYGETQKFMSDAYNFTDRFFAYGFNFTRNDYHGKASYFVVGFIILLIASYCVKKAKKFDYIVFPFISMILFFLFVAWHPNWTVLMVPFLVLWMGVTSEFRVACIVETVYALFLIVLSGVGWVKYYDIEILNGGILPQILNLSVNPKHHIVNIIKNHKGSIPEEIIPSVFAAALFGFLFLIFLDIYRGKRKDENLSKEMSVAERPAVWIRIVPLLGYILLCFVTCFK